MHSDPGFPAGKRPMRPLPKGYACLSISEVLAGELDQSHFAAVKSPKARMEKSKTAIILVPGQVASITDPDHESKTRGLEVASQLIPYGN